MTVAPPGDERRGSHLESDRPITTPRLSEDEKSHRQTESQCVSGIVPGIQDSAWIMPPEGLLWFSSVHDRPSPD